MLTQHLTKTSHMPKLLVTDVIPRFSVELPHLLIELNEAKKYEVKISNSAKFRKCTPKRYRCEMTERYLKYLKTQRKVRLF